MTKPKTKPTKSFRKYFHERPRRAQFAKKIGVSLDYFEQMLRGTRPWGKHEEACREVFRAAARDHPDEFTLDHNDFSWDPNFEEQSARSDSQKNKCESVRANEEDSSIYVYLKRKGWSIRKLVKATGISQGIIQRVLAGRPCTMAGPDFGHIVKIAKAIGVMCNDIPWMDKSQRVVAWGIEAINAKYKDMTFEEAFKNIAKHMDAAREEGAPV